MCVIMINVTRIVRLCMSLLAHMKNSTWFFALTGYKISTGTSSFDSTSHSSLVTNNFIFDSMKIQFVECQRCSHSSFPTFDTRVHSTRAVNNLCTIGHGWNRVNKFEDTRWEKCWVPWIVSECDEELWISICESQRDVKSSNFSVHFFLQCLLFAWFLNQVN